MDQSDQIKVGDFVERKYGFSTVKGVVYYVSEEFGAVEFSDGVLDSSLGFEGIRVLSEEEMTPEELDFTERRRKELEDTR